MRLKIFRESEVSVAGLTINRCRMMMKLDRRYQE
jgi:hypothetical protein